MILFSKISALNTIPLIIDFANNVIPLIQHNLIKSTKKVNMMWSFQIKGLRIKLKIMNNIPLHISAK